MVDLSKFTFKNPIIKQNISSVSMPIQTLKSNWNDWFKSTMI